MSIIQRGLYTSVANVTLTIPDVGDRAHVTVEYDVEFSDTDQLTNQAYEESFKLVGVDTELEGSTNDELDLGVLLPYRTVRPNGEAEVHRTREVYVDWAVLNEDVPLSQNPDEIQAKVKLIPILPEAVKGESEIVTKTIVT